jgi:hypothetical protein
LSEQSPQACLDGIAQVANGIGIAIKATNIGLLFAASIRQIGGASGTTTPTRVLGTTKFVRGLSQSLGILHCLQLRFPSGVAGSKPLPTKETELNKVPKIGRQLPYRIALYLPTHSP